MESEFSLEIDKAFKLIVSSQENTIDFKVEERKIINSEYYQVSFDKDCLVEKYNLDSNNILKSLQNLINNKALQYTVDSSNMILQLNDSIKLTLEKKKYENDALISILVNKVNELYIENEKKSIQIEELTKEINSLKNQPQNQIISNDEEENKSQSKKAHMIDMLYNQIPKYSIKSTFIDEGHEILDFLKKKLETPVMAYLKYRAKYDGDNAYNFHRLCDGIAPTLTVIKTTNGKMFGGYTEAKWVSTFNYIEDDKAFLFKRVKNTFKAFDIVDMRYALRCKKDLGPSFGEKDICINDKFLSNEGTTEVASYSMDESYELIDEDDNDTFSIKDIEVYYIEKQ